MDVFPLGMFCAGFPSGRLDVCAGGCRDAGVEP
jgi:hypothetical protein